MKKLGIILLALVILLCGILLLQSKPKESLLHVSGKDISLMVVDTPKARTQGLSGINILPENSAMLFVFEYPDRYTFWMKDMNFPIDIIWLDADYKIIHIESALSPSTYPATFGPSENSSFVLETNALFAQKNNLKAGDILDINLLK